MNETKELILNLIERAKAGNHTKFEQLHFFSEYLTAYSIYNATNKIINILKYSANNLFQKYCRAVTKHQADVNLILAYKQLQCAVNYYIEELKIINEAIIDYESYLLKGNFIKAILFGEEREL